MMEAIGIRVKDWVPVVVYATKEGKFKYRTTEAVGKKTREGGDKLEIHHSLAFSTLEEAVGSASRFIKKTWDVDLEALPEEDYGFEHMDVAERVVPKISAKIGNKLMGFLQTLPNEEESSGEGLEGNEAPEISEDQGENQVADDGLL